MHLFVVLCQYPGALAPRSSTTTRRLSEKIWNSSYGQLGLGTLGLSTHGNNDDEQKSSSSGYGELGLRTLGLSSWGTNDYQQRSLNSGSGLRHLRQQRQRHRAFKQLGQLGLSDLGLGT